MMNKRLTLLFGIIMLQCSATTPTIATAASTDGTYTLQYSTFATTGAQATDTQYQVTGASGQAVAGQTYLSPSYALNIGFWQAHLLPVMKGDLDDNGQVDLTDLIGGLQGLTGQDSPATMDADVNGDGKIETAELIHIMRKQAQLTP